MMIVQLIYVSKIKTGHGPNDVLKIVDVSEKNNKKLGITGALCYGPRYFLQCLEGPRDDVNKLYNKIVGDPRHTDVTLLYYTEIEERTFGDWAMAYVRADEVTDQIVLRFSPSKRFDPYGFSAQQAVRFLQAVAEEHQIALESKITQR
jgi:hypothetical protein